MLNFGTPSFPRGRALPLCVCVLGGRGGGLNWLLQALTAILHMVFQIEFPFKAYLLVAPYTNAQNQIPPTT